MHKIQSDWTKKGQSHPSQQPELPSERHDSSGRTCALQVRPVRLSLLPQILPSLRVTQTQRLMLRSELHAGRLVASRTPCSSFTLQTALNHRLAGSPGLLSPPHWKTVWLYSVSFPLRYSWGTDIWFYLFLLFKLSAKLNYLSLLSHATTPALCCPS